MLGVEDMHATGMRLAPSNIASAFSGNTYKDLHQPAFVIGGCFALAAVVLSLFLILQHLRSYTNPAEQKWIVAVLFMVPVYARGERRVIELLENKLRKQLDKPLLEETDENRGEEQRSYINFFFRPCVLGKDLLSIEKFGLVQYMILKTVCAFLAFLLELFGVYGDGEFKWYYGYPYLAVVLNFSQMWALYCLVKFYNVTHEGLEPIKPLAKFISFKAIVFATWWQGVGIALLCAIGVLAKEEKLQTGLQDFLICIEMAIAAVAHMFVFSAKPYHYLPPSEHGKVVAEKTEEIVTVEEDFKEKPAVLENSEMQIQGPGTSITKSVQDIVVEGGQHVVKDVVLTVNQAMGPVEKGVTKIQERFHRQSVNSDDKGEGSELEVEEESITATNISAEVEREM